MAPKRAFSRVQKLSTAYEDLKAADGCVLGMCEGAAEDSADQADPDGGDTAALREVPCRTGHARANHTHIALGPFLKHFQLWKGRANGRCHG